MKRPTVVVIALLLACLVASSAVAMRPPSSVDFTDAEMLQDSTVYELDMTLAADPNFIDMIAVGRPGNGMITLNISDPETLCIDGDPNQCGGNVQNVIIRIKSLAGNLFLDSYYNVPGASQGNVTQLFVTGYWTKDAFKLIMSYRLDFFVANSAYGAISGTAEVRSEFPGRMNEAGRYIGPVIGINAAYTSATKNPYQIVVVSSQLDMTQQRPNVLISRRGISAYSGAVTRFIPYTNIHSLPAAIFASGHLSSVVFANNQISGSIDLSNPSHQLVVVGGNFTASIGRDADIHNLYTLYNGIVTDTVNRKTYFIDNVNIIASDDD